MQSGVSDIAISVLISPVLRPILVPILNDAISLIYRYWKSHRHPVNMPRIRHQLSIIHPAISWLDCSRYCTCYNRPVSFHHHLRQLHHRVCMAAGTPRQLCAFRHVIRVSSCDLQVSVATNRLAAPCSLAGWLYEWATYRGVMRLLSLQLARQLSRDSRVMTK